MLETQGSESNVPRSRIGAFWGPSSARGAKFRGVLASRASEGQGGLSAQGLNRMGSGIERPRRCSGRCPGGPASGRASRGRGGNRKAAEQILEAQNGERLDFGAPGAAVGADPQLATVGGGDGARG